MKFSQKLWLRFGVAFSEPGTWRGIVMILTSFGIGMKPDQQEAFITMGLAVVGLINVFFKDDSNPAEVLKDDKDKVLNSAASLEEVVANTRVTKDDSDNNAGF